MAPSASGSTDASSSSGAASRLNRSSGMRTSIAASAADPAEQIHTLRPDGPQHRPREDVRDRHPRGQDRVEPGHHSAAHRIRRSTLMIPVSATIVMPSLIPMIRQRHEDDPNVGATRRPGRPRRSRPRPAPATRLGPVRSACGPQRRPTTEPSPQHAISSPKPAEPAPKAPRAVHPRPCPCRLRAGTQSRRSS